MTSTLTQSQADALQSGGLEQHCLEHHLVCAHCGACTYCHSGCQCDDPAGYTDCDCGGCDDASAADDE